MHKLVALGLTTMLALSATACSLPGTGGSGDPASQPPAAPPATTSSAPSDSPPAATDSPSASDPSASDPSASDPSASGQPTPADPSQPSGGDQLGSVVATRTSAGGGRKVTLRLYPVLRDGATSHVNLTLSSPVERTSGVQVGELLADGDYNASDKSGLAADGIQLVDGKNAKLYLVASDGRGQCLCSRDLSSVFLSLNAPVLFSATFAAPPPDVTQVDVRIPNFGTVKNVPVQ
jgi:hypothetical protein